MGITCTQSPFNEGVHTFKVKCLSCHTAGNCYPYIGLCTKPKCKIGAARGTNVTLGRHGSYGITYVFDYGNIKVAKHKQGLSGGGKTLASGMGNWEPGEIMEVIVDCERWKLSMRKWKDGKKGNTLKSKTVDIEKNTYFPALTFCVCIPGQSDLKLLL